MLRSVPRIASRLSAIRPAVPAARTLHSTRVVYADAEAATGLTFNFTLPAESLYENTPVEMVILPGSDGQFGVMPNHVPTVTQLKPGVVSVQEEAGGPLKKFFISGGFAYGAHRATPSPPIHVHCAAFHALPLLLVHSRRAPRAPTPREADS